MPEMLLESPPEESVEEKFPGIDFESLLPDDVDPEGSGGRHWLRELDMAIKTDSLAPFFSSSRLGHWLVDTLRSLGYHIETKDNPRSVTTTITKFESPDRN